MSFERFSSSDVYIFEHVGGFIQCCGCWLDGGNFGLSVEENENSWSVDLKTPREALAHLDRHEKAGHDIGGARRRIEKKYEDLDAPIEPYVRTLDEEARNRERFKKLFGDNNDA
jgi:hypothetical protein